MTDAVKAHGLRSVGFLLLIVTPVSGADVTPTLTADRTTVRLSESVRVTLTIEGRAPLRVELPMELLDEPSAAVWRLRPAGPATLDVLPGGKQRWSQPYRADPYEPGDAVRLGFAPAQVFAGGNPQPVRWPDVMVKVTTDVKGDLAEARPPTGIEHLPLPPPSPRPAWEWLAWIASAIVVVLAAGFLVRRLLRRRATPLPPREWAERELDRLAADSPGGPAFAERLSGVLRTFLERRTGLPSTRLTTTELVAAAAGSPTPVGRVVSVLEWSDRIKFAGWQPTHEECTAQLADARTAVAEVSADDPAPNG